MPVRFRRKATDATRQKMSQAKRGAKNPMYGRHQSAEAKNKIRHAMLLHWRSVPE